MPGAQSSVIQLRSSSKSLGPARFAYSGSRGEFSKKMAGYNKHPRFLGLFQNYPKSNYSGRMRRLQNQAGGLVVGNTSVDKILLRQDGGLFR